MTPCPHCGKPINPASLMGKLSAGKRKQTSAEMSEMAKKGWAERRARKCELSP